MARKIFVLACYGFIALAVYFYGESLFNWIQAGGSDSVIITTLLATLLALFPIIPYPVIGGVLGAAYGPVLGSLVTWIGSSAASIIMFAFVRYGYQDWGHQILHRYKALSTVTHLFERNAFLTIFMTRMIPIIPSMIVNIYAALSRVSSLNYAIASSIGKVPAMILFAVVGNSIVTNPQNLIVIALFYGAFLFIVYLLFRIWKRLSSEKLAD